MRKQQQQKQQQSLKPPNQTLLAKKTPTASTSPHSFFPEVSDSSIFLSTRPLGPFQCAGNSTITESPTSDVQMQDPQLERLVASIPALYSDAYDIDQIMKLYSFPDDNELDSSSFHSLYQYLSPIRPSQNRVPLRIFAGSGVALSPEQTWFSMTSWSFATHSLRDSLEFQKSSSVVYISISLIKALTNSRQYRKGSSCILYMPLSFVLTQISGLVLPGFLCKCKSYFPPSVAQYYIISPTILPREGLSSPLDGQ